MAHTVASIIKRKTKKLLTIIPSATVLEALQLMADNHIGSLVVMEDEKYLGIISERDYARKVVLKGKHSQDTPVAEIMNSDAPTVTPEYSIDACLELVSKSQTRYLPIIENGKVTGIISILDLIEETSIMHKESAEELRNYISST